jgi:hypothetical protein
MRHFYKVCAAFGILAGALVAQSAAAESPQVVPPIGPPSGRGDGPFLGEWVESKFQEMVQSCSLNGSKLKMNKLRRDELFDVSAVPTALKLALDLDNGGSRIEAREGKDIKYLFGNVYTETEAATLAVPSNLNYLSTLFENSPDYVTMPRMNGAGYVQSCATAMSAALDANAGFTFPVGSIKGGFDADYAGKSGFSLNLIKATFKSPTLSAYAGAETADQSPFNAAMTMFGWYRAHPARLNTANKLLDNFEGVAIYRQSGFKRNVTIDANASFKVGVPLIATSSGSVAANAEWLTDFHAEKFSVAVFKGDDGKLRADTVSMPSATDVAARASTIGAVVIDSTRSGSDFTLYNRKSRTIYFLIQRLPADLCNASWRVTAPGLASSVATVAMGAPRNQNGVDGWPACSVPVTFRPAPAMPLDDSIELALTFELPLTSAPDAPKVSLAAETVPMPSLDKPHLALTGNDQRPKVVSKTTDGVNVKSNIRWNAQYQLTDEGAAVAEGGLNISRLTLACTPPPDNFVTPTREIALRAGMGGTRLAELTLNAEWNGDFEAQQATLTYVRCTLSGSVEYTLASGPKVTKDFPTLKFLYPVAPQPPRAAGN